MRHLKHKNQLGVKKEHRLALMANMASSLFIHGRIQTTLTKAKALRPFSERIVTLAKKAHIAEKAAEGASDEKEKARQIARSVHLRRQAVSHLRNTDAVKVLFNERAAEFVDRPGGYTRIYKLGTRLGDAAEMGMIELINADDEGYPKKERKATTKKSKKNKKAETTADEAAEGSADESEAEPVAVAEEAAESAEEKKD